MWYVPNCNTQEPLQVNQSNWLFCWPQNENSAPNVGTYFNCLVNLSRKGGIPAYSTFKFRYVLMSKFTEMRSMTQILWERQGSRTGFLPAPTHSLSLSVPLYEMGVLPAPTLWHRAQYILRAQEQVDFFITNQEFSWSCVIRIKCKNTLPAEAGYFLWWTPNSHVWSSTNLNTQKLICWSDSHICA